MTDTPQANMTPALMHEQAQMLMARPWDAATDGSIWDITGDYPRGKGMFTHCLAMVAPGFMTGTDDVLFVMAAPGIAGQTIPSAWVTTARELQLVDAQTGKGWGAR